MASRYYSPLDYQGALAMAQQGVPNIMDIMDRGRLRAVQEGTLRQNQAEFEAKQKAAAEYAADVAYYEAHPTDENLSKLMLKYPDMAQEGKVARDVRKDAATERELTRLGELDEGLRNNDYPLVLKKARERQAADAAADLPPDPFLDNLITALESGDEKQINRAKAAVKSAAYKAIGGKEYAEHISGGKPSAFKEKLDILTEKGLGQAFLETEAYGAAVPIYQGETLIGQAPIGSLPRVNIGGGGAPAPAAAPGEQTFKSDDGSVSGTFQPPDATGLKRVTSDKWGGASAYLVHSAQEYERVPSGAIYIAPDGEMRRKK